MAAKRCLICNYPFSGRRDAKTCSPRCRKRLQKVRFSFLAKTVAVVVAILISILSSVLGPQASKVSAASSTYLNFQARLLSSAGNVVADGDYNIEFKFYDSVSSGSSAQGVCSLNSSSDDCWWMETKTGGSKVRVVNGYMSTKLGSVTGFGSSIPWNQELWLTMNIGGTGGSPSWDGEMSPRIQLTAIPYAFRAEKLVATSGGITNTLEFATPSASNKTITIPNATGTVCLENATSCGFAPASGSNGYIQLQGSTPGTPQTGHFNISGTGIAGILQAATFDTATAVALNIGTTNATAINLNQNTTVAAAKSFTANGTALFQNSSNSTTAFQIQNAAGSSNLFIADTTNTVIKIGTSGSATQAGTELFVVDAEVSGALRVGDGTNNSQFDASTHELTFNGTARHTRRINLIPEFPGATMSGDTANNAGTMSSDFCSGSSRRSINTGVCASTDEHNYYTWTSGSGNNDYDIYILYQIPSDFSAFASDTTINMYGWRTDATTNTVDLALFQANGTQCGTTTNVATGTATWTETALSGSETGCTVAAGDKVLWRIHLDATAGDYARAGEIRFDYLSKW